jgi:hypothetical protein
MHAKMISGACVRFGPKQTLPPLWELSPVQRARFNLLLTDEPSAFHLRSFLHGTVLLHQNGKYNADGEITAKKIHGTIQITFLVNWKDNAMILKLFTWNHG